jgi:hypothetical protein
MHKRDGRPPEPDVFREARVEAVKRALGEGRFEIDAEAIADRMLEAAKALVGARQKERWPSTFRIPSAGRAGE